LGSLNVLVIIWYLNVNVVLCHSAFLLIRRWLFHAHRFPHEIQKARLGDGVASATRCAQGNGNNFGVIVNARDKTVFWTASGKCSRHFGSFLRYPNI